MASPYVLINPCVSCRLNGFVKKSNSLVVELATDVLLINLADLLVGSSFEAMKLGSTISNRKRDISIMSNLQAWKYVFQVKAVINWVESVALLFTDQAIRQWLNEKPLANPKYSHLFLALVFIIGIAYWWVGQDISRNLPIIKFGIYAQTSVFVVLAYHTLIGNVHPFYLIPGIIDLTFAILFSLFLYSNAQNEPALE